MNNNEILIQHCNKFAMLLGIATGYLLEMSEDLNLDEKVRKDIKYLLNMLLPQIDAVVYPREHENS